MRYVVEHGYDAGLWIRWYVRDKNTNQYVSSTFDNPNTAEIFAETLNKQNTNQKEKDTMQINWKDWKGVPRDANAINDSAVQVLEDLKVDEDSNGASYVMGGDTLVIGFRDGDKMIALYKCKILATAEFTERTAWVQEN